MRWPMLPYTHSHTQTNIYIYICVCVCGLTISLGAIDGCRWLMANHAHTQYIQRHNPISKQYRNRNVHLGVGV